MAFSDPVFLFLFLPALLALYHALPQRAWRNGLLLAASLLFYCLGEARHLWVLLLAFTFAWAWGLGLERLQGRRRLAMAGLGVTGLLGLLAYFKLQPLLHGTAPGLLAAGAPSGLPLGISFFAFQAVSYLVDVQRGQVRAEPSLARFALYKSFFPQLIAGPIVRYRDMQAQLGARPLDLDGFTEGGRRFAEGLAKKLLLADVLGRFVDAVWALPAGQLSRPLVLGGVLAYGLQVYFDFSGYSDMAVGLARLFGFRFPENFAHPYAAASVREFWRRWHISLSTWFRDYLYLPLGGSRHGALRTGLNLWAVFLLCGLWHGVSWNFLLWGAWFGLFLSLERLPWVGLARWPRPLALAYAQAVVFAGWLAFRSPDLPALGRLLKALAAPTPALAPSPLLLGQPEVWAAVAIGVPLALGLRPRLLAALEARWPRGPWRELSLAAAALLLLLAALRSAGGGHQSFLYFNF